MGTVELDLLQYQSAEAKKESDYQTFGARVLEDMVDDLMMNRPVAKVRGEKVDLAWILEGKGFISDLEAALLVAASKERRIEMLEDIEERAKQEAIEWVHSDDARDEVAERVRNLVMEVE